ncbi:MAG: uracil-DNA glycosylase family protein [Pseudomonadota bacterium]
MSLNLDKRQRAMLREMGVRVWSPMAPVEALPIAAPTPSAIQPQPAAAEMVAVPAVYAPVAIDAVAGRSRSAVAAPAPSPAPVARPQPSAATASDGAAWQMGEALALYAESTVAGGPRWLVLAETPVSAWQGGTFNPFEGDAGTLLDNMLRAARLPAAGSVTLAPLSRQHAGTAVVAALPALVAGATPDVVLVMGRLASQALLQSTEPFGKLRGQVHSLQGIRTIVTHDAAYLLRNPLDKGKAWDDLCLAMATAAA